MKTEVSSGLVAVQVISVLNKQENQQRSGRREKQSVSPSSLTKVSKKSKLLSNEHVFVRLFVNSTIM